MSDQSIFGERSGSAPVRVASAPTPADARYPARGLFGSRLAGVPAPARQTRFGPKKA